jgi:hypothetical protein
MQDVISAFLDNEPFDARELSAVLATQEGRDLLIDLIALRSVVQPPEQERTAGSRRRPLWMWASAAAVLLALFSGYQFGRASDGATPAPGVTSAITAPEPTNVLKFEPGVNWTESPRSGGI